MLRLADRRGQALDRQRVLGPDIDVAVVGTDRVAGDGHALQHLLGAALQDAAIHEGTGIALVTVADHVLPLGGIGLGHCGPFETGGITGAASAADPAPGHLAQHLGRGHGGDRLGQRLVATDGDVVLDPLGVDLAAVLQHHLHLVGEEGVGGGLASTLAAGEAVDHAVQRRVVTCRHVVVHPPHLRYRDERSGGAETQAADALHGDVGQTACGHPLAERVEDGVGLHRQAARGHADVRRGAHRPGGDQRFLAAPPRRGRSARFGHSASSICCTPSGDSLPCTSSSMTTAGAMLQAPRQRARSSEIWPSGVVPPASMPSVS